MRFSISVSVVPKTPMGVVSNKPTNGCYRYQYWSVKFVNRCELTYFTPLGVALSGTAPLVRSSHTFEFTS